MRFQRSELYQVMEEADAFILSMRNLPGLYRYGMSFNKLCDYVASGRPVLFAGIPAQTWWRNFNAVSLSLRKTRKHFSQRSKVQEMSPQQRAEMGRNGIRCAKERFDIAMLAGRLESMLISVVIEFRGPENRCRNLSRETLRCTITGS